MRTFNLPKERVEIGKSGTADTRSCDYANTSKRVLLCSSMQHINDVGKALNFFIDSLVLAASIHDADKLSDIDSFHADFITGFKSTLWWDRHRQINRHHLSNADGVPDDVNLIDVLEYVADCVMAGMGRSRTVFPLTIDAIVLSRAFQNTVELIKSNTIVNGNNEI